MKLYAAILLAAGCLLVGIPGLAQTNTAQQSTPEQANPRANTANDQSGPTSEERTDATPYASTPGAERPVEPERNTTEPAGKTGTDRVPIDRTTDLPESQSRPDSAVIVEPPPGYSNVDPNLKPDRLTRPRGVASPTQDPQNSGSRPR